MSSSKPRTSLPTAITRRDILAGLARLAALGCVGVFSTRQGWASPEWMASMSPGGLSQIPRSLLRNAPVGRFWISANSEGVACGSCHAVVEPYIGDSFRHENASVQCQLCARRCVIAPGERGQCRARANVDGKLRSLVYGHPVSVHVDPIEKKPFYHFIPGSAAFSLATTGCPLRCRFCQNWEISQASPEDFPTQYVPPVGIVDAAQTRKAPIIAYTYNEPTVFSEYLLDIAKLARERSIRSVLVSCGFMNEEPLNEMCDLLDGIKIDLKGFSQDFYEKVSDAKLEPVLRSIRQVARRGVHLEIVNLVVPSLNDSEQMLSELCKWVVGELGPDVPVHFTRFHPDYRMLNLPPTPVSTLEKAYETARRAGMHYPYVGNVPGHPGNHTHCPRCSRVVVKRTGFFVIETHVEKGLCKFCGESIAGVWT